jgi:diguanylate cyclase (GGDEF)-like protein/PAS domain S-box-containing protein
MQKAQHLLLRVVLIAFLLFASSDQTVWNALAENVASAEKTPELIAAIPRSFPPQYEIDAQGKPTGFAIEIMEAVAKAAGYTMVYQVYDSWVEAHQAVREGHAQLIPNIGITEERKAFANFTAPVETFNVSLFVRDESIGLNSLHDLHNRKVGVIDGNVAIKILQNTPLNLKLYDHFPDALFELMSGGIDAVAYPDPVVWRHAQSVGLDHRLRPLSPPLVEIKRAIGVHKDETALLNKLNQAIEQLIKSDLYEQIFSHWYAKPQPFWSPRRILLIMFTPMVLVIALTVIWRFYSLKRINLRLVNETALRRDAESELQQLNADLEATVRQQTRDLAEAQRIGEMGSWILDLQQDRLIWSDQTYRIFEVDPKQSEATYDYFLETVHPHDRDMVNNTYQTSLIDKKPYEITHRLLFPDGRIKWVLEQCETQFDVQGTPRISRGTVQDITERKLAERKLALTQHAVDHISEGAFLITPDGYFRYVNPTACDSLGYTRKELLTMCVSDIDPITSPEQYATLYESLKQVGSLRYETLHQHKEGHSFPVEIVTSFIQFEDEEFSFAVARNISEIKSAHKEIENQRALLQRVIDGVSDPILMIGTDFSIRLMNQAARESAPSAALKEHPPKCYAVSHHIDHPCQDDNQPCPLRKVMSTEKTVKVVHKHIDKNGLSRTMELLANPLFDSYGNVTGIIESGRDITDYLNLLEQLKKNQHRLNHIAHHDSLTGLPNRLLFIDRLEQAILKAKRNKNTIALLFIDLDRFKQINDSFGHPTGDKVLKEAAIRLKQTIREEDTTSRIGGDEFTVILDDIELTQDIVKIADKLLRAFRIGFPIQDQELFLTCSIGISIYPQDGDDANTLIRNADSAMYKAKDSGRNAYSFYTAEMTALAFERLMMENSLRGALEHDQLVLYYQPQLDMSSGQVISVEALVRWQHPEMGLVPPAQFIPLAEETGLIQPIGEWILRQACSQTQQWWQNGLSPQQISVNCNLSGHQLNNTMFYEQVIKVLHETEISAEQLELEITETTIMNDPNHLIGILNRLRDIGIKLAIDDFGTGYSSLAYLKALPISKLKIDKSFIRDISEDPDDMAIIRAIIGLGRNLQIQVIAEGVETQAQADFLQQEGCFLVQGFLYAKPMPAEEFENYLISQRKR